MDVKVDGRTVTATIHLDEGRPASTRKSTILFTTNGYVPIEKGMRISINIIAPNDKADNETMSKNGGSTAAGQKNGSGTKVKSKKDTHAAHDEDNDCCARREGARAQPERPGPYDIAHPGRSKARQKRQINSDCRR